MKHLFIHAAIAAVLQMSIFLLGCSHQTPEADQAQPEAEAETLSRTVFTDRVENYFEYEPLETGKASPFLIHLTDLSDGTPVETAEVTLTAREKTALEAGSRAPAAETVARVGKVIGIYVAELNIPRPGDYDIEFHIKNDKLDERMSSSDFTVE